MPAKDSHADFQSATQTSATIYDISVRYFTARPLRSASTTSLVPKRNKTVRYGRRMIDTSSATLWNSLPNNIKCARNVLHFKRLAKLHLTSS